MLTTLSSLVALYAVTIYYQKTKTGVIMMTTVLSLTVLQVVKMKTCSAQSNDKVSIVITLHFKLITTLCNAPITEWQIWHRDNSAFAVPHIAVYCILCYVAWFFMCVYVLCSSVINVVEILCNLHTTTHICTIPHHILYVPIDLIWRLANKYYSYYAQSVLCSML